MLRLAFVVLLCAGCRSELLDPGDAGVLDFAQRDLAIGIDRGGIDLARPPTPFSGTWHETMEVECGLSTELVPYQAIKEMIFDVDGNFKVTWQPFETFVDYWGTYEVMEQGTNGADGLLSMKITGGNSDVPDFDGFGRYTLPGASTLLLTEMWLGKPPQLKDPGYLPRCGHRFVRN